MYTIYWPCTVREAAEYLFVLYLYSMCGIHLHTHTTECVYVCVYICIDNTYNKVRKCDLPSKDKVFNRNRDIRENEFLI